jgi:hypothetical protein
MAAAVIAPACEGADVTAVDTAVLATTWAVASDTFPFEPLFTACAEDIGRSEKNARNSANKIPSERRWDLRLYE